MRAGAGWTGLRQNYVRYARASGDISAADEAECSGFVLAVGGCEGEDGLELRKDGEGTVGYRNKTYVVFDGDKDKWSYAYMKGWKSNENMEFNFHDAHDIAPVGPNAQSEAYIKRALKERFASAKQIVCLVGENTKSLYRYVRWELDVALDLNLPIIAVNLNGMREMDPDRCPPIIKNTYTVHVPFKAAIIQFALDHFPSEYSARDRDAAGCRHYNEKVYNQLGL